MERSLESIIEEIAQSEELSKEFMAMDEIDEIYAYCKEMGLSSSEEEFDEEVSSMIDNFDSNYSKIGDFELENVAGGSMLDKNFNKIVASALSALTIVGASAANSNFTSAANATSTSTNVKSSSKMEYTKEKFNEIKNSVLSFCKKHKIAVGVTTAAIILAAIYTGVAVHKGSFNPRNLFVNTDNSNGNSTDGVDVNTSTEVQSEELKSAMGALNSCINSDGAAPDNFWDCLHTIVDVYNDKEDTSQGDREIAKAFLDAANERYASPVVTFDDEGHCTVNEYSAKD